MVMDINNKNEYILETTNNQQHNSSSIHSYIFSLPLLAKTQSHIRSNINVVGCVPLSCNG